MIPHKNGEVSIMWFCKRKQQWTYKAWSWARLPIEEGIVPLNWLSWRNLNGHEKELKEEVRVERVGYDVGCWKLYNRMTFPFESQWTPNHKQLGEPVHPSWVPHSACMSLRADTSPSSKALTWFVANNNVMRRKIPRAWESGMSVILCLCLIGFETEKGLFPRKQSHVRETTKRCEKPGCSQN